MKEFLKKEWVQRALRTFLQATFGYIAVNIVALNWGETDALRTGLLSLGGAAISAGIAAVMNIKPMEKQPEIEPTDSDAKG